MTAKQSMLILVIGVVLIAGVVVFLMRPDSRASRGKPLVRAAAPAPATPGKPAAVTNAAPESPVRRTATPVDRASLEGRWLTWLRAPLRDPFLLQPPPPPKAVVVVTPASQLKLSGLWVQTGSRLAVINGGVYGEEDVVMGFRILRIDKDQVQVQGPEKTEFINFTTYVADAASAAKGTNWVQSLLGPEKETLRY